jgi:predicted nucleic acid-binding protein
MARVYQQPLSVVEAAAELGCDVLWTEDMNDGQLLRGVHIRNPFTGAVS